MVTSHNFMGLKDTRLIHFQLSFHNTVVIFEDVLRIFTFEYKMLQDSSKILSEEGQHCVLLCVTEKLLAIGGG